MTRPEMERQVSLLLLKQKELLRLNLELPPNQLLLLQRLLYRLGWTKMSRTSPKRYAKFNSSTAAHPLVSGFPIEHSLRSIANNPISTNNAKNLAVAALKGHTEALWGLHDELHEHNHPILEAGYNWLNAADKLHLDKHTYTALNEAAQRRRAEEPHAEHRDARENRNQYLWQYTPEYQSHSAALGLNSHPGSRSSRTHEEISNRVRELSPNSTPEEINESIRRHAHRASQESVRRIVGNSSDSSHGYALMHPSKTPKENAFSQKNEVATRYYRTADNSRRVKYSLANKSNFIGALLKSSSPEHKLFVKRTKELAHRVGAQQTREFPALHDTPNQSVPGVAMAVYGHIQPNSVHALGSWVNGLLPNSPGYAVFHNRPTGPDTLYRIRMEGSGYDAREKLNRAGVQSRVFIPHKKGLDILIPDKGNRIGQQVEQFAQQQKVSIEASLGHLTTVGSQDQGQARSTFRNKIATHEAKMTRRESAIKYGLISIDEVKNHKYAITPTKPGIGRKSPPPDTRVHQYEPGLLPPIPETTPPQKQTPKGVKQQVWNPTMVPPKTKPLFSHSEYNRLHNWANNHAFTHTPSFAKFLGKERRDPEIHKLLTHAITYAAHEMRRSGKNSVVIGLGNGKRLKINIPKTSWVNTKLGGKVYKPPASSVPIKPTPVPSPMSRYSRRRDFHRRYTNSSYQ